jgi:hypothetical protein
MATIVPGKKMADPDVLIAYGKKVLSDEAVLRRL